MAELIIGRHAKANTVTALRGLARGPVTRAIGGLVGFAGMITVALILSFYAIVSGWMLSMTFSSLANLLQFDAAASWLATGSVWRDTVFTVAFMMMTLWVVTAGVHNGIEKWASRLMPSLFAILLCLIVYVMTLDGAMEGLRMYLVPDFSRVMEPGLVVSAMGQAFFSLSLGVGTMLIYGSYINRRENLPALGRMVTLLSDDSRVELGSTHLR